MIPTITFHAARYLARGLYLEMTRPERRIPKAENTKPTVPGRNFGNIFLSPGSVTIIFIYIQDDKKKRELLKNPTKIEEIQEKNLLTEIEPLKLAF